MAWLILAAAVTGNVLSNVMFKLAMDGFPNALTPASLFGFLFNPFLWLGGLACVLMLGCYLYTLRELGLANTYAAVTSLSLIGVTLVGAFALRQPISLQNALGICLVLGGILIIAMTSGEKPAETTESAALTAKVSAG